MAIGWHLAYEGYTKVAGTLEGTKPFTAEMYLRQSTGPLRFYFRGLVDDYHGLGMLEGETVVTHWNNYVTDQAAKQGLDDDAKQRLGEVVKSLEFDLKTHLDDKKADIARYKESILAWEAKEQRPLPGLGEMPEGVLLKDPLPKFEWDAHKKAQKDLDKTKAELVGPIMKWSDQLVSAVKAEALAKTSAALKPSDTDVSSSSAATVSVPGINWKPQLDLINKTTMWGLLICGSLLIVGLFTRTAALGGAALLCLFYLSMPPWPGLDPAPIAEGSYLIVNKNLVEFIALLMIASSPVGVWGGLDSIIRGTFTRPVLGVGKNEVLNEE